MSLSPRDQAKWDRLQDSGGGAIDNILAGKGTEQDLRRISEALKEQHEVAGQLFDQRVQDAELTADTIVDRLNRERVESGKRPLTQRAQSRVFQSTFQQVMSQAIEDILQMVHDDLEEQSEQVRDSVAEAMAKLRRSVVAQVEQATPEGEVPQPDRAPENESLMARFTRQRGHAPTSTESTRSRSLMDRVLGRNRPDEAQRTSVMQIIRDAVTSTKDKITSMYDRFRNRSDSQDEDARASIWIRKLKAVFDPARRAYNKAKRVGSKLGDIMGMIGKPLLLALMSPLLIKGITDSVSHYLNFDNISKFMTDMWDSTKKFGSDSIDWVIEKVKNFFGLGKKKEVKQVKPKPVELGKTGNTLPTELPKSVSAKQASTELPKMQQGLDQAVKTFAAAQDRYKANPTAANKKAMDDARMNLTYWQNRVAIYQKRSNDSKTAGSDVSQATSLVTPSQNTNSPTTGVGAPDSAPAAPAAVLAASSVPAPVTTIAEDAELPRTKTTTGITAPSMSVASKSFAMPTTTIQADMPQFTPGKAFEPMEKIEQHASSTDTAPAAKSQIGIGSFGFDSNDSALNILNLGMLA